MATGNANRGQNVEDLYPDMFGKWSSNDITNVFGNLERTVTEKMQQDGTTKQQLLSQPGNSKVFLSQLLMNISLEGQQGLKDITSQEKRVQQNKVTFLIALAMKNSLSQDALAMFIKKQHIKEANAAYRKYILAKAEDNYKRMIEETERIQRELEEKMNQLIADELDRIRKEIEESLENHDSQIKGHRDAINDAYKRADETMEKYAEEFKSALDVSMAQSPVAQEWLSIPDAQRKEFVKEIMMEDFKDEIEMENLQNKIESKRQEIQQFKEEFKLQSVDKKANGVSAPSPGSDMKYTPHREVEIEFQKNPEYKTLSRELRDLERDFSVLQDKQTAKKDNQVQRIGERVFGTEKMMKLNADPNFSKRVQSSEFHQIKLKAKEDLKEHKDVIVKGEKEIIKLEKSKKTVEKANMNYANSNKELLGDVKINSSKMGL